MVSLVTVAAFFALSCVPAYSDTATPVEKVITLLKALQRDIETEGKMEARSYDSFACFCKDTTSTKSTSITTGRDTIGTLSAEIESKTAKKAADETDLADRRAKQEEKAKALAAEQARCQKEKEEYEAIAADLSKAISSLEKAHAALTAAQPASFLAVRRNVEKSMVFADALSLSIPAPTQKAVNAFLQVDPTDPTYKYHSEGILQTITELQHEFVGKKTEADDEYAKTKKICDDEIQAINDFMDANKITMDALDTNIETLKGDIATARTNLVETEALLKDDQAYLKDLTQRCEARAKDWDQRSQMRAGELEALAGAQAMLDDQVRAADQLVNERAMLLNTKTSAASKHAHKPVSFLQEAVVHQAAVMAHGQQGRQDKVAALLTSEGVRLHSSALAALATHVGSADPFKKIKQLIQDLIERLLAEAHSETNKKSFCDEALGKAYNDRDFRMKDTNDLNVELGALEVKKDELEAEISTLTDSIKDLQEDLANATTLREDEKAENAQTIETATEGLKTLKMAIDILKQFYSEAAKSGLAYKNGQYQLLQASPVDEDTDGPGFSGSYRGQQTHAKGIIGMLDVIKGDFERTLRVTEAAEKKAHADFVEFDRTSKADISGKTMKKELDEADLVTTKSSIAQKMADLQSAQDQLDSALKIIEGLKPTCLDTGMSYEDRVAKREEEIAALKKALCILDEQQVEAECQR